MFGFFKMKVYWIDHLQTHPIGHDTNLQMIMSIRKFIAIFEIKLMHFFPDKGLSQIRWILYGENWMATSAPYAI